MTDQFSYDVAIVGASIAGSAAAILFARKGAKVALIERDADPAAYKKVCTHYIQASATPTLERLGLAEKIEAAGGVRNELDFYTRWGRIRAPSQQTIKRPAFGYNIRREKLDPMLRQMAAETPGVDFISGFSAHELLLVKNRICGVIIHGCGGVTRRIEARLTVGADGRNSRVAELAGFFAKEKPQGRIGYFAHYRDIPLKSGNRSQMWFLEPDIAYTFPNDDGVTLVAAQPTRAKLEQWKRDPEAAMKGLFAQLPDGPNLERATRLTPFFGTIEYPNLIRKTSRPGLALIGDAAMSIDPLWGVGCGWAFQSAEWLADIAGASCQAVDEARLDRDLSTYARTHRSKLAAHEFLICDYSTGRDYNFVERLMYSAAARDSVCADQLLAFGARCITVGQFLSPKALARAAWVNIRHAVGSTGPNTMPSPAE
ncbi:NAD(P)/FAD-dependent oxidoreductase [Rhodoblastus sp. 17X3]|uniref:NAD(P)/FAD-dependent oxidoreductase n=1 Tax=Rhodoblastus sp. 17X3 TaxID=3047026 RepID=UPI0024B7B642|nr:NAD(P)/FAD-dependent oxidoreductase [Rhodoblastus sp. 17X3]MDI9848573.1 NAD(P)/FAD-dependent oxidoreductase [Rhodoblastus sp. 17X3]